jgi:hypothetical protein
LNGVSSLRATALAMGAVAGLELLDATHAAPGADCPREAAALTKEQAELPRLEIASPRDRPPYCITLETLMGFSGRVKAHIAQCPALGLRDRGCRMAQITTGLAEALCPVSL